MSVDIFAHRGASRHAPENTFPAFKLAYEHGADGIETDVHLTKDNIPVLIHDETVKRTTVHSGYIKDLTMAQLKEMDAGSWFSKKYTGTPIISLEEFLKWIEPTHLSLNIELKNNKIEYDHLEHIVYEMLDHFQMVERTTLSTFNKHSIKRMDMLDIEIAYLSSRWKWNLIRYGKQLGADAVHIKHTLLSTRLIKQSREENMRVRVYTVNKMRQILKCFNYKCCGLFTDLPQKAIKLRGGA